MLFPHHLMQRNQPPLHRLITQPDFKGLIISGNGHQLPGVIPLEVLTVFMAIVNAPNAPFTFAGGIGLIEVKLSLCGLHNDHPLKGAIEREALFIKMNHITRADFA